MSCAGEEIYLVGGANSAGQAAMHFANYAAKVHMIVRGDSLARSMSKYLIDQIAATPNIIVETGTEVVSMSGDNRLECVSLKTPRGPETRPTSSIFIFIGAAPKTDWLPKDIALDPKGFILAGDVYKRQSYTIPPASMIALTYTAATTQTGSQSVTWTKIAVEGQTVFLPAGTTYRFGVGSSYLPQVTTTADETLYVYYSTFGGDPAPGVVKELDLSLIHI